MCGSGLTLQVCRNHHRKQWKERGTLCALSAPAVGACTDADPVLCRQYHPGPKFVTGAALKLVHSDRVNIIDSPSDILPRVSCIPRGSSRSLL